MRGVCASVGVQTIYFVNQHRWKNNTENNKVLTGKSRHLVTITAERLKFQSTMLQESGKRRGRAKCFSRLTFCVGIPRGLNVNFASHWEKKD